MRKRFNLQKAAIVLTTLIMVSFGAFIINANQVEVSKTVMSSKIINDADYPLNGIHKKLDLTCTDCHKEEKKEDYSNAMYGSCFSCHGTPAKLTESTGYLGHTNNIHDSPHWGNQIACDTCHKAHKPTQNLCLQCHEQNVMKNLFVK
ncbi:MAG: cytochrome c3 family protein [Campylobacteraceae bacterium]